jgi:putative transposase
MTVPEDYRQGRYVVSGLHVHPVFVTTYRRDVLTGEHIRT